MKIKNKILTDTACICKVYNGYYVFPINRNEGENFNSLVSIYKQGETFLKFNFVEVNLDLTLSVNYKRVLTGFYYKNKIEMFASGIENL